MGTPKPYGPAYQELIAHVALERGCGMAAMACLYYIGGKIRWETGVMPDQLAHKTLGKFIGGASYNTVAKAMRQLREAGVIEYASRGNNYDGGEANIYKYKLPPTQNLGTPLPKNWADPYPNSGHLNPSSFLSKGDDDAASRGEEDTNVFVTWEQLAAVSSADWVADTRKHMRMEHEDIVVFSELARAMRANDARRLWKALQKKEALRAAENE